MRHAQRGFGLGLGMPPAPAGGDGDSDESDDEMGDPFGMPRPGAGLFGGGAFGAAGLPGLNFGPADGAAGAPDDASDGDDDLYEIFGPKRVAAAQQAPAAAAAAAAAVLGAGFGVVNPAEASTPKAADADEKKKADEPVAAAAAAAAAGDAAKPVASEAKGLEEKVPEVKASANAVADEVDKVNVDDLTAEQKAEVKVLLNRLPFVITPDENNKLTSAEIVQMQFDRVRPFFSSDKVVHAALKMFKSGRLPGWEHAFGPVCGLRMCVRGVLIDSCYFDLPRYQIR